MRVPLEWLHEFTHPQVGLGELADTLTMTGTKVEALHTHGVTALEHFVVGKVLTAEPHPDADRLRVCTVDVGDGEPSQIVCGAPNVAAGQTVAVARPGAVMPDGTRLKKAKLRGQASAGMILAEDELEIGTGHRGIMVLDDGLAAGTPLADVLPIHTDVIELEITPNRPDCLGVYGVAREVHAATGAPLAPPPWAADPGSSGPLDGFTVAVETPERCPRFTLRLLEDVTIGESPTWLKARLMAAGMRPINTAVDISNYVMLLTGQPNHVFDADRVDGARLTVRTARAGETVTTLDDVERPLDADTLVIADDGGPTSIAGVMGGARSEVHAGTTRIAVEVATWDGPLVQRTSTRLGLRSEASGRNEKGLSPDATLEAQALLCRLFESLCGARVAPGTIDIDARTPAQREVTLLRLREARVRRLLGVDVERAEQARILESLGFVVAARDDGLEVEVPHWRRDVTREVDLVEEVARIHGVDTLPATLPTRRGAIGVLAPEQRGRRRAEDALVGAGLFEVVGWSFTADATAARLRSTVPAVRLRNPMSEEQAVMRTTVLGSLLDAAALNARRGAAAARLFEIGAVYLPWSADRPKPPGRWDPPAGSRGRAAWDAHELPDERTHVGALLTGPARPATWRDAGAGDPASDFFTAKAVLEALGRALRVPLAVVPFAAAASADAAGSARPAAPAPGVADSARPAAPAAPAAGVAEVDRTGAGQPRSPSPAPVTDEAPPYLHPARAGRVLAGPAGTPVGWVGEVHPAVAAEWDLEQTVAAFELDLALLLAHSETTPRYVDVTSYPAIGLDLAVVVDAAVPAATVLDVVRRAGGKLLASAEVFDVYVGGQVGAGRVSLALRLSFRAPDRTLTDADVAPARDKIVTRLREAVGGELRGS